MQGLLSISNRLQYGYYQILDHCLGRERSFRLHQTSRRRLFSRIHGDLASRGREGVTKPIKRVGDISDGEFIREFIMKGEPVVLEGKARDWSCVKTWSFDYFRNLYGKEEVLYVKHEAIESDYEFHEFGHLLDLIENGFDYYYRFYPLLQRHPEHIRDFDYNWLLNCRHKWSIGQDFQVLIGGENSYTPLHNAFSCNVFSQISGKKEWIIYPPYHTLFFDPDPAENVYRNASYRQGSVFNPFKPDYETHPLLRYVDRFYAELSPGDILFNPSYWWHSVSNPTKSIGVGYRWFPPLGAFSQAPLYSILDLFTSNPSIWKSLKLAETDVNLIQLAQTGRLDKFLEKEQEKSNSFYSRKQVNS